MNVKKLVTPTDGRPAVQRGDLPPSLVQPIPTHADKLVLVLVHGGVLGESAKVFRMYDEHGTPMGAMIARYSYGTLVSATEFGLFTDAVTCLNDAPIAS